MSLSLNKELSIAALILLIPTYILLKILTEVDNFLFFTFVFTIGFYSIVNTFKKNLWLTSLLLLINVEFLLIITLKVMVFDTPVTSWRYLFDNETSVYSTISNLFDFIFVISWLSFFIPKKQINEISYIFEEKGAKIISLFFIAFSVMFLFLDYPKLFLGKILFSAEKSSLPFMEVFNVYSILLIVYWQGLKKNWLGVTSIILFTFFLVSFFITGFRGVFVSVFICLFIYKNILAPFSLKKAFSIFFTVIVFLSIVGVARIGAERDFNSESFINNLGNHEENEFYTLVASYENLNGSPANTYVDSILRLLPIPNDAERASVSFANSVLPNSIVESGINMGIFYIGEGVWNFGLAIGYLVSLLFVVCFFLYDGFFSRLNTKVSLLIYMLISSQVYTFCYYGSSNFTSIIFNGVLILGSFSMLAHKVGHKGVGSS